MASHLSVASPFDHSKDSGVRRESVIEDLPSSLLSAAVDGARGLSTATATRKASEGVRPRSRSPRPSSNISPRSEPADSLWKGNLGRFSHASNLPRSSTDLSSLAAVNEAGTSLDEERYTQRAWLSTYDIEAPFVSRLRDAVADKWEASKGPLMVCVAMLFGALMGTVARLMETSSNPMNPMQILFARQSITAALSMLWMWWKKVPDAPLGRREVRPLLIARGFGGFFGVFGFYFSVQYIPLGEATVITFLTPMLANAVCSVFLKDTFTRREALAGVISLIGVIFIARPTALFASLNPAAGTGIDGSIGVPNNATAPVDGTHAVPDATPSQRLLAIGTSLLGVCGGASAYTTIRWIGKRAHPLISVNYFSVWCTIVSTVSLLVVPSLSFRLPSTTREWLLLASLGVSGMALQFLLTAGLAHQRGSAATNMTYTQMIWVLVFDYVVFGTVLTWASWLGCALILASQIWGATARGKALREREEGPAARDDGHAVGRSRRAVSRTEALPRMDEEVGLVSAQEGDADDEGQDIEVVEMGEIRRG